MGEILVVGLGGFVGCTLRYLLDKGTTTFMPAIPLGTLMVNVIAGLAIGFILGFEPLSSIAQKSRLFVVTGLLGGLSTFSAFSAETVLLFENGQYLHSGLNVLTNVGFSLIAVVIGLFIARTLSGAIK